MCTWPRARTSTRRGRVWYRRVGRASASASSDARGRWRTSAWRAPLTSRHAVQAGAWCSPARCATEARSRGHSARTASLRVGSRVFTVSSGRRLRAWRCACTDPSMSLLLSRHRLRVTAIVRAARLQRLRPGLGSCCASRAPLACRRSVSAPAPPGARRRQAAVDEPADGVVRLTISNPAKRNALDHPILDAITATLARAARSRWRGPLRDRHGRARDVLGRLRHRRDPRRGVRGARRARSSRTRSPQAIDALEAFPYPTLAALPGHTIGGGLELALACDLRVGAEGIKLGMPPAKLGLVYSHTGLRRFIDAIGAARTRELFLLGSYIDADTALRGGSSTGSPPAQELEGATLDAGGRAGRQRAALADREQARDRARCSRPRASCPRTSKQELIELRRASFASRGHARGDARVRRERRAPRWQRRVTVRAATSYAFAPCRR